MCTFVLILAVSVYSTSFSCLNAVNCSEKLIFEFYVKISPVMFS
jgi:hypothetical protein